MVIVLNEEEISRLRNKLNESRIISKVLGVCVVALIVVTLFSFYGWYEATNLVDEAIKVAEESKFVFYYASLSKQRYGVDDLEEYLNRWKWVEGAYTEGEFDCSEMSAVIERRLENEGYHTKIVVGHSPSNRDVRHAWLLVETSQGKYMPVEATQYELVRWDDPYFDLYFDYDHSFETIFDALDYNYDDFNWWES